MCFLESGKIRCSRLLVCSLASEMMDTIGHVSGSGAGQSGSAAAGEEVVEDTEVFGNAAASLAAEVKVSETGRAVGMGSQGAGSMEAGEHSY